MNRELWEDTELAGRTFPFNIFHTAFQEHDALRLHWHEHFEMIRVERGEALFQIGGQTYQGQRGDLFFVNSGELHAIQSPRDRFTIDVAVFHPSMVGMPGGDHHAFDMVSPYTAGLKRIRNRLPAAEPEVDGISRLLMELVAEFNGRAEHYEQAVRALCQLLFTRIVRRFDDSGDSVRKNAVFLQKTERLKALLQHVEQHLAEPIPLDKAAAMVHLSPYHFCKMFKQLTGMTFVQYVNGQRMAEAERLLRGTALTVTEIAERVGCGGINSFSKLYKQLKGITPTATRQQKS
ncbi:AraC family transcriptional regulator [Paenibacillus sp. NFR01]|uniref:AraC family transcriptional regulator n=1 Tax=Paenibacillus sp. NFR01 TaxID=1566279 RepID=UPI0008D27CFF|nr:AraC family transcriptional regulator [Paenibacillus sp. NFR01]SET90835.1 AraC-type DNA-binding protein [Paenibacillus sp. NFR01]